MNSFEKDVKAGLSAYTMIKDVSDDSITIELFHVSSMFSMFEDHGFDGFQNRWVKFRVYQQNNKQFTLTDDGANFKEFMDHKHLDHIPMRTFAALSEVQFDFRNKGYNSETHAIEYTDIDRVDLPEQIRLMIDRILTANILLGVEANKVYGFHLFS